MDNMDNMDNMEVVKMNRTEFDNLVYSLLIDNDYLLAVGRKIDKLASETIPTMGVAQNPQTGRILFVYNPAFAGSLKKKELKGTVKHELFHIVFNHTSSEIEDLGLNHKIANIAMDLEINQYIEDLPKGCVDFQLIKEQFGIDLDREKSWKHYYREMIKGAKEQAKQDQSDSGDGSGQSGSGSDIPKDGQFDQHKISQDVIDELGKKYPKISGMEGKTEKEINEDSAFKKQKRQAALQAAEIQSRGQGIGSLPARIQSKLKQALDTKPIKPNWEKILKMSVTRTIKSNRAKRTYLKRNKKLKGLKGRKKRKDLPRVLIACDQSGSVPDSFLLSVAKGLNGLTKHCSMDLIPFDVECYPEDLKHFAKGEKVKFDRVAAGGTNFDPVSEYARRNNYDLIVIVSDGEAHKPKDLRGITRVYLLDREPQFQSRDKVVQVD